MRFAVFIDEAERVFGQRQQVFAGEGILDSFLRISRAFDIWVFMGNQTLSSLSPTARKTAGAKVFFSVDNSEVRAVAESTGMSKEQADQFVRMEPGRILVKMHSRPQLPAFFAVVPSLVIDRKTPRDEIDAFCAVEVGKLRQGVRLVDEKLKAQVMALILKEEARHEEGSTQPTARNKTIAFLAEVSKNDFRKTKELAAALGVKPKECSVMQIEAAKEGLVELFNVKLDGKPGAPAIYTTLTRAGSARLEEAGALQEVRPTHPGKGEFLHALLAMGAREKLTAEKGVECRIEDGGADIGVYKGEMMFAAVEISHTTTSEHELHNIRRNLTAGWPRIFTVAVCTDKSAGICLIDEEKSKAKKSAILELVHLHLSQEDQERVIVLTFTEFRRLDISDVQ